MCIRFNVTMQSANVYVYMSTSFYSIRTYTGGACSGFQEACFLCFLCDLGGGGACCNHTLKRNDVTLKRHVFSLFTMWSQGMCCNLLSLERHAVTLKRHVFGGVGGCVVTSYTGGAYCNSED